MPFSKATPKKNPKWKKYKCALKSEHEKVSDLYEACREGRDDIVKLLTEEGKVDVNKISSEEKHCQGLSALHITARHNQPTCMKILLQHGAKVNIEDSFRFRPIHDASLYGHLECLKELLTNGATTTPVSNKQLNHVTPLFYAAQQNHIECVKLLKQRSPSNDCLMWDISSKRGNVEVTDLTTTENIVKRSMTDWLKNSAISGHTKYMELIRDAIQRNFGENEALHSLHTAVQHGHLDYLEELLKLPIDPNICNEDKTTALHYAARFGQVECIEMLIKHGADISCRAVDNQTPLLMTVRQGPVESVVTLLQHGADVNEKGGDCEDTPLHVCLKEAVDDDIMKEVLKYKPDLTITNKDGKKPTDIVSDYQYLNELLLEYARN